MINLKLGDGKNKYKIKFKYIETGRTTIKNVYADSIEEAMKLFNEEYKDFKIEIISTEQLEEGDSMEEKCCNKCGSDKLFVEIQGNRRGLYCGNCGKWQKWITKQELQIAKFRGYKIINKEDKQ